VTIQKGEKEKGRESSNSLSRKVGNLNETKGLSDELKERKDEDITHDSIDVVESSWWPWVESDLSSIDDSVSTADRRGREGWNDEATRSARRARF